MPTRSANAVWEGTLKEGKGTMKLGSGAFEGSYTFASRFEDGRGTNPDELIGAALAGCFSMFLSSLLTKADTPPTRIQTNAKVHLADGKISPIELDCEVEVPGVDDVTFQEHVQTAKQNCPVSRALAGADIVVNAKLVS
jgi:osmotically inducible protein OsmC